MIHPRITKKLDGQFLSLFLKPLDFFSCQQSSPTTLDESSSRSISYFIIAPLGFIILFISLLGDEKTQQRKQKNPTTT